MTRPALTPRGQDRNRPSEIKGSDAPTPLCFGNIREEVKEDDTDDEERQSPWKDRAGVLGNEHERYGFRRGTRP